MKKEKRQFTRVNDQIKVSPVRVVKDGEQLGVMPLEKAKILARNAKLDLVEIAPQVKPPVCSITDYGKFRYQQSIKEKDIKQKSKGAEVKEIRLSPKIANHDIDTKTKSARKFIKQGKKVQFNLLFKGRDLAHKDTGFAVVKRMAESLEDVAQVEMKPKLDGRRLICRLEPKK